MLNATRRLAIVALAFAAFPGSIYAAALSPRSVQLGSSQAGVATSQTLRFTTATTASIGSIGLKYCTTASGACTVPTGLDTTSATLSAQSGATGFSLVNAANGAPYLSRSAASIGVGAALSFTLSGVVNPTAVNTSFFVRITTYTGSDGITGAVDTGTVALSTAQEVHLTGVTPEILVFCVGLTVTSDCTTMTGSSIDFGDFSPVATRSATSVMQAATNASGGYNITVNGTTLASGVNTIAALTTQTAAVSGVAQYGLNLRQNTVPAVGANPANPSGGTGTYSAAYGIADQYRFVNADVVATATQPTNATSYTVSYIANIGGSQAAGVYTATMTYICTANF